MGKHSMSKYIYSLYKEDMIKLQTFNRKRKRKLADITNLEPLSANQPEIMKRNKLRDDSDSKRLMKQLELDFIKSSSSESSHEFELVKQIQEKLVFDKGER